MKPCPFFVFVQVIPLERLVQRNGPTAIDFPYRRTRDGPGDGVGSRIRTVPSRWPDRNAGPQAKSQAAGLGVGVYVYTFTSHRTPVVVM